MYLKKVSDCGWIPTPPNHAEAWIGQPVRDNSHRVIAWMKRMRLETAENSRGGGVGGGSRKPAWRWGTNGMASPNVDRRGRNQRLSNSHHHIHHFLRFDQESFFPLLFFLLPTGADFVAKTARVFPVKRLDEGRTEWVALRKSDDHSTPCHRLQDEPVTAKHRHYSDTTRDTPGNVEQPFQMRFPITSSANRIRTQRPADRLHNVGQKGQKYNCLIGNGRICD